MPSHALTSATTPIEPSLPAFVRLEVVLDVTLSTSGKVVRYAHSAVVPPSMEQNPVGWLLSDLWKHTWLLVHDEGRWTPVRMLNLQWVEYIDVVDVQPQQG